MIINSNLLNDSFLLEDGINYYYFKNDAIVCFNYDSKEENIVLKGQKACKYFFKKDNCLFFVSTLGLMKYNFDNNSTQLLVSTGSGETIFCVQHDENWIYFSIHHGIRYGEFYKIRYDGSQKTLLLPYDLYSIFVSNGWIYYADPKNDYNMFKMTTDGDRITRISDCQGSYLNVYGGWIYFSNISDNQKAYKIRVDGSDEFKLNDDISYHLNVCGSWLYYLKPISNTLDKMLAYKVFAGEIFDTDEPMVYINGNLTDRLALKFYTKKYKMSNSYISKIVTTSGGSVFGLDSNNQIIGMANKLLGKENDRVLEYPFPKGL